MASLQNQPGTVIISCISYLYDLEEETPFPASSSKGAVAVGTTFLSVPKKFSIHISLLLDLGATQAKPTKIARTSGRRYAIGPV